MRHASIPQLLAIADAMPDRYRALVLVAGYGGLCWGELVGLHRRHVDLATARVTVAEQVAEVVGRYIVGPPKTAAGPRVVTLPTVALDPLVEHLGRYANPGPDGLVFPTRGAATWSGPTSTGSCGSRRWPEPDHRAPLP
jgi:integrase